MSKRKKPDLGRNIDWMRAKLDQARSSAARPHKSKKAYTRKTKHKKGNYDA